MTDEKEYKYPIDDESLGQMDLTFDVFHEAVDLAVTLVHNHTKRQKDVPADELLNQAYEVIKDYGDVPEIPLPYEMKRKWFEYNYEGEGEIWMQRNEKKRGVTLVQNEVIAFGDTRSIVYIITREKDLTEFVSIMRVDSEAEARRIHDEVEKIYGDEPIAP